ncbi:hypothetical protein TRVL_05633 [Trypanosoma vivax]|nr:hypothetical protein TRVL_05633 [Trypanosoma vivax]
MCGVDAVGHKCRKDEEETRAAVCEDTEAELGNKLGKRRAARGACPQQRARGNDREKKPERRYRWKGGKKVEDVFGKVDAERKSCNNDACAKWEKDLGSAM